MNFSKITTKVPPEYELGEAGNITTPQPQSTYTLTIPDVLEVGQFYTFSIWLIGSGESLSMSIEDKTTTADITKWNRVSLSFKATKTNLVVTFGKNLTSLTVYQAQLERGINQTEYSKKIDSLAKALEDGSIKNWCYDNNMTYIDGGKIYAGTVTAKQIDVDSLFAESIKCTNNFEIDNIQHHTTESDYWTRFYLNNNDTGILLGNYTAETRPSDDDVMLNAYDNSITDEWNPQALLDMGESHTRIYSRGSMELEYDYMYFDIINKGNIIIHINTPVTSHMDSKIDFNSDVSVNGAMWCESLSIGDNRWFDATLTNKFTPYSTGTQPRYKKYGDVVTIDGAVKPTATLTGSTTGVTIFTLPEGYRPSRTITAVMQGSGLYRWLLTVTADGSVTFARYGSTALVNADTSAWLPFSFTFMI